MAGLGLELVTPGCAVRHAANCPTELSTQNNMEPGDVLNRAICLALLKSHTYDLEGFTIAMLRSLFFL